MAMTADAIALDAYIISITGLGGDQADWQDAAICSGTDPEAFFPEKGGSVREAKQICRLCPVQLDCLDHALVNDERFGVWGGFSERERRRMKRGEAVTPTDTNKPNLRSNGHGHACRCDQCEVLYR